MGLLEYIPRDVARTDAPSYEYIVVLSTFQSWTPSTSHQKSCVSSPFR